MPALAIALAPDLLARLYAHARAAYPAECCGYLTGPRDAPTLVDACVPCRNAQDDDANPNTNTSINPGRTAERGFTIAGAELFAFARSFDGPQPARILYHSHPNGRAYFSDTDRDFALAAGYPVQHLVIGLDAHRIVECAQFAVDGDTIIELARWAA